MWLLGQHPELYECWLMVSLRKVVLLLPGMVRFLGWVAHPLPCQFGREIGWSMEECHEIVGVMTPVEGAFRKGIVYVWRLGSTW